MKTIVTYQSKTGFTKKYAEWISEALSCEMKEASKVTSQDIADKDLVIHGGWVMGGMVNGLEKVRRHSPKKLIVFAVGFTAANEVELTKWAEANKLGGTPFFYFEGGMNPPKMGLIGRKIVKAVTKKAPTFTDNTNKGSIADLVKLAGEM